MSATRCQVVLASMQACGVDRPHPRWSNSSTQYFSGIEQAAMLGRAPAARSAVQEDRRLAAGVAAKLPIHPVSVTDIEHAGFEWLDRWVELRQPWIGVPRGFGNAVHESIVPASGRPTPVGSPHHAVGGGEGWIAAPTAIFRLQFRELCLLGRPTRAAHFDPPAFAWR